MKKNITLLRTIAILLVVIGHITFVFTGSWVFKMPENPSIVIILCKLIYTFHMPVFISISGYLFYYTIIEKNSNILLKEYIIKKLKRLIIPFCTVLILWVIPIKILAGYYKVLGYDSLNEIILFIIKELDFGHLWYLPVLFILDILMFIFYKKIEHMLYTNNILKNTFVCILALMSIFYYLSDRIFIYIIGKILKLAFFYYIGYLIRRKESTWENIYKYNLFFIMLSIDLISIVFKGYISSKIIFTKFFTDFLVFALNFVVGLVSLYILYSIAHRFERLAELKIVKFINNKSMDIYLFHEPIIYIVIICFNNYSISSPYLFLIISGSLCIGISILIAQIVRKLNLGILIGDKK